MFRFDLDLCKLVVEIPLLLAQISVMAFLEGWNHHCWSRERWIPSKYSFCSKYLSLP